MAKRTELTTLEMIESEYKTAAPQAQEVCEQMVSIIKNAIETESLDLAFPVESRVKSLNSIVQKLRGSNPLKNIYKLERIKDLIGIRLVVCFSRDVDLACDLLQKYFIVDSVKIIAPHDKEFGYQSIHYIVKLKADADSNVRVSGTAAEVQIRTLAQHCWSAASHKLHYKSEFEVAKEIKRPLDRVAALLEIVDDEFNRLLEARDEYLSQIDYEPDDTPLNIDNLESILRRQFVDQENWFNYSDVSYVLEDLQFFSVDTRGKLKNLFSKRDAPSRTVDSEPQVEEQTFSVDPQVLDYDYDYDSGWEDIPEDESPDAVVLTLLAVEYPQKWRDYQLDRAQKAFADIAAEYIKQKGD
ncbi:RelA/SpoT domain-containing protein [Candidatus Obscuribacterales bacterium]|nr:RelA/SpoT domain-containing protein [Candidatus Obscuribacterales bacterium]